MDGMNRKGELVLRQPELAKAHMMFIKHNQM